MADSDQIRAYRDYYLQDNEGAPSIYHIWEEGRGRGDVTTPAQSSPAYQEFLSDLLRRLLAESPDPGLLSVGCGNAMIEASLSADGFRVLGVDALEDAVELAKAKGVNAVCADVYTWTPPPGPWTIVYADGILGHLYTPTTGILPALQRFQSWLPSPGILVISNDPPRDPADEIKVHPDLPYYFLSQSYMRQQVEDCGYHSITSTVFTYQKPLTGPRDRIVITARI